MKLLYYDIELIQFNAKCPSSKTANFAAVCYA